MKRKKKPVQNVANILNICLRFTQEGVAALSGVLRSPIAIQVNISIMRAFVALRQMITGYQELLKRIEELEEVRMHNSARYTKHLPSY